MPPLVLHLCSDFAKQRVYAKLVTQLAQLDVPQRIYAAVRSQAEADCRPAPLPGVEYHIRHILRPAHRLFFRTKTRMAFRDACAQLQMSDVSVVHAHFLYSDGAVALKLKRAFGIPYVVNVRNTDLNVFMRYRPDLKGLMVRILQEAERVVFVAPSYQEQLLARLDPPTRKIVRNKMVVIPNGVDATWLQRPTMETTRADDTLRLLYVGDFTKNKNVPGLLKAASLIAARRKVQLTLVGGGGDGDARVHQYLQSGRFCFAHYVGRVEDDMQLREIYRKHDVFVMPSFRETFGVVYIEALSQGLPIVYSQLQAVDGYFDPGTVAEGVDPYSPDDIAGKILALASRLPHIRDMCVESAGHFGWPIIAKKYEELYRSIAPAYREHAI